MRIVLEASDLLEVLGAHLGMPLSPEQVEVRTEPALEIEITGAVRVGDVRPKTDTLTTSKEYSGAVDISSRTTRVADQQDSGMSMKDILEYSRQIEGDIARYGR